MTTTRRIAAALVAAATLAVLAPSAWADATEDIKALQNQFSAYLIQKDALGIATLYTGDATILPPKLDPQVGRDAIQRYWRPGPNFRILVHAFDSEQIVITGQFAYDYGSYQVQARNTAEIGGWTYGKYVRVWKKQPDSSWKIHLDIWNQSPEPKEGP